MSSGNWQLEKGLCRCCHSEGSFKNLAEPVRTTGLAEIYADMLNECFDIDMAPVPGLSSAATYTICEVCVIRLRDASDFKKQVLSCEERFKALYNQNGIKVAETSATMIDIEVKQEILYSEPDEVVKKELPQDEDDNIDDDEDYIAHNESLELKLSEQEEEKSPEEEKPPKVKVAKKRKTKPKKAVTCKTSKKKKRKSDKEENADEENDAEKKQGRVLAPKFRLNDDDYKKVGDTYQCARCDKTYDKMNTLKFHLKTKHYKIARYKCSICMKEFMTPAPLTVHKLEAHNVDDRFNCRACNKIFNTKVQLRKHINNFHMLGERYKCEFCDYESFSFEGMYKHKFKHKTVKDYHCKFCRKSFLRKTTLDLHERIHTGDRRKVCTVCGQAFVQKASLNYHMTKYHPEVNF